MKKTEETVREKPIVELVVTGKIENLRISLENRRSALTEDHDLSGEAVNDNLTDIVMEFAIDIRVQGVRQDTGERFEEPKDLIKQRRSIKDSIEQIE